MIKTSSKLANASNDATMSSREIANVTGKQHKHVLVDCEKLNEHYVNLSMAEISAVDYTAKNGQQYKQYLLTRIQCFDLITGYDTELRIKVNRRWEELEKQQVQSCSLPSPALPPANKKHCVERQELVIKCNGLEMRSKGSMPFSYDHPCDLKIKKALR